MSFTCHDLFSEEMLPAIAKLYEDATAAEQDPDGTVSALELFSRGLAIVIQGLASEYDWSTDAMTYFLIAGCLGVDWTNDEYIDPINVIRRFKKVIESTQEDIKFKNVKFTSEQEVISITPEFTEEKEEIEWLKNKLLELQERLKNIQGVNNEDRSNKEGPD